MIKKTARKIQIIEPRRRIKGEEILELSKTKKTLEINNLTFEDRNQLEAGS